MIQQQQPQKKKRAIVIVAICFLAIMISSGYFVTKNKKSIPDPNTQSRYVPPEFKKQGELSFLQADGSEKLKLDMEVADNRDEQQTGMMRREEMPETQCMLFIFPDEQPRSFWMSNTKLPLDIIFVNSKKEIVSIQKNAMPFDESHYWSEEPAQYVVEVIGGFCDKHTIAPGDKISWVRFDKF
ncbi:MAG: DUF192 domain-containing protein [Candidatus Zixiibacteriota bacterium]